jgi:hypothetical protein
VLHGIGDRAVPEFDYNEKVELESLHSGKSPLSHSLLAFSKPAISFGDFQAFDYNGKFGTFIFRPFNHFFLDISSKSGSSLNQNFVFKASRTIVFRNIRV